ncbi:MAG: DUF202 domain-containing protein [Gammaproteobacteria bacterium]|nr:DUF202 domain-containing protein [Gammaproteobacteria bacterium]
MQTYQFLIAILGMLFPLAIMAMIFRFDDKSEKRFHDTVQRLLEKGQPIDEEVMRGIPGYKKKQPRNDIRSGGITLGVGIGIILLGHMALGPVVYGSGYLVACIGGAIFAYGIVTKANNDDNQNSD